MSETRATGTITTRSLNNRHAGLRQAFQSLLTNVTIWHLLYLAIFVTAVLTRFWDLGSRALHHDESLHTYYSWVFSEGGGYSHHPMMHGPFLFHFNALSYLLFGDSDYTSRLTSATVGVALVMLPWFLRGRAFLGRWGALSASFLILMSPSILYYSRFIRHDIFALMGALLIFIAFVRYMEKPESRWIVLAIVSVAYVLTTHEITFVNLFIMGTFAGSWILYRVLPWSFAIIGSAAFLFLVGRFLLVQIGVANIPEIPWREPTTSQVLEYFGDLLIHPVVVLGLALALFVVLAIMWMVLRARDEERGWIDSVFGSAPEESTAGRFAISLRDGRSWLAGAVAGAVMFVVLYTSLFSNLGGLGSGTFGAIGYWLGQHDVQRGQQPWFYYLVLAPQYEFLAIAGTLATTIFLAIYAFRHRKTDVELDRRFYFLLLLLYWLIVMFLVLSWAGEKMPWLIVHFLLPMLLLGGAGIGRVVEWIETRSFEYRGALLRELLHTGLPVAVLVMASALLLAWATAGPYVETDGVLQRSLRTTDYRSWWIVYLPVLAASALVLLTCLRDRNSRVFLASGTAIALLLFMLQVHVGWNVTYRNGDVPRDMLVYVQTAPHVPQTVDELRRLSLETHGDLSMPVVFTGTAQWPLNWYLRDFSGRTLVHEIPDSPTQPIIIATPGDIGDDEEAALADYTWVQHPLRWWIPEDETYRRFAIAPELNTEWRQNLQTDQPPPYSMLDVARSVGRSLWSVRTPEQQARLFRLVMYRELDAPIGAYSYRIYVHNDFLTQFNAIRYGETIASQ